PADGDCKLEEAGAKLSPPRTVFRSGRVQTACPMFVRGGAAASPPGPSRLPGLLSLSDRLCRLARGRLRRRHARLAALPGGAQLGAGFFRELHALRPSAPTSCRRRPDLAPQLLYVAHRHGDETLTLGEQGLALLLPLIDAVCQSAQRGANVLGSHRLRLLRHASLPPAVRRQCDGRDADRLSPHCSTSTDEYRCLPTSIPA